MAAAAATAATAASRKLQHAALECSAVFLIENVERRQTDVGDFFFSESNFVQLCGVLQRRHIRRRPAGCGGCAPG
jgi:hypothetical protein